MRQDESRCCGNCLYGTAQNPQQGTCSRYPPVPQAVGQAQTPQGPRPLMVNMIPTVDLMHGWCGEWQEEPKIRIAALIPNVN